MYNVRKTIQERGKLNTLAQTCCMCFKNKWNVNHIFLQKSSRCVTEIDWGNVTTYKYHTGQLHNMNMIVVSL